MGSEIERAEATSSQYKQDGVPIDRIDAKCSGSFGVVDTDATTFHFGAEVLILIKGRVTHVQADEKANGDVVRGVTLKIEEGRAIRSSVAKAKLLLDYGFDIQEGIIDVPGHGDGPISGEALAHAAEQVFNDPKPEPKPELDEESARRFLEEHVNEDGELDQEGQDFVASLNEG